MARKAPRSGKESKPWVLGLFGLPFLAAGLGVLLLSVLPTLWEWGQMQQWQPAQATVLAASLQEHRGSKSSVSFSVQVHYRYTVAGQTYEGRRAAIQSSADNVGHFQESLAERLEAAQRSGTPVQIWYDPDKPHNAVADRSLRPELLAFMMVFVLLFGGVGLGLVLSTWRAYRGPPASSAALGAGPRSVAWTLQPIAGGVRLTQPMARQWIAGLVLLVIGGVCLAMGMVLRTGPDKPLPLLGWGLALVGGALLAGSFYAWCNSVLVQWDHDGLYLERRLLGLVLHWQRVPNHAVARLQLQVGATVTQGERKTIYYNVLAQLVDGKALTLVDNVPGRQEAEKLLMTLGKATGCRVDLL